MRTKRARSGTFGARLIEGSRLWGVVRTPSFRTNRYRRANRGIGDVVREVPRARYEQERKKADHDRLQMVQGELLADGEVAQHESPDIEHEACERERRVAYHQVLRGIARKENRE